MKAPLKLLGIIALVPGIAFAELADFGARSEPAEPNGFTVLDIAPNTPAEALGLQLGDIVTHLDGRTLHPTTSLARLIAGIYSKGDELTVNWSRDGKLMSGKVTLDREISESAFNRRYDAPSRLSMQLLTPDSNDAQLNAALELARGLQASADQLQQNDTDVDEAISNFTKMAVTSDGSRVRVQSTTRNRDGDSISTSRSGGGESKVKITDKAGEVVFEGTVTEDTLDEVPEKYRDRVDSMLNNGSRIQLIPGGSFVAPPSAKTPEKSINDLLKDIETQEGE